MEAQEPRAVSRRTLMKASATAGVATAAVGFVGVAAASPHASTATDGAAAPIAATDRGAGPAADSADLTRAQAVTAGNVVVHLIDQRAGHVEVFTDGHRRQLTDHDLAAHIARAAKH